MNAIPAILSQLSGSPIVYPETSGGLSTSEGLFQFNWHDVTISPVPGSGNSTVFISNNGGGLQGSTEYGDSDYMKKKGNKLYFHVDTGIPTPPPYNKRSEIYLAGDKLTGPFTAEHPAGTEEWFGWTYYFPNNWQHDSSVSNMLIYQSKPNDEMGYANPVVSLQIVGDGGLDVVRTEAGVDDNEYTFTGVTPTAGMVLKVVMRLVHHPTDGVVKIWMNGLVVYNGSGLETMMPEGSGGGTSKWGIYISDWGGVDGVLDSAAEGITEQNISIGPLKVLRRFPENPEIGVDENSDYNLVKP